MQNITATGISLTLDSSKYIAELKSTTSVTKQAFNSLEAQAHVFADSWSDITRNMRSVKSVVSSMALYSTFKNIAAGVSLAATAVASFSSNMENAAISMKYFIDGADKATQSLAYLREMQQLAADTSFTTETAVNLSKFMSSMGINIRTTKSVMTTLNDAAAATGASEDALSSIVTALGQILTKGRLAAEEVRQLANANIPIYDILQEELNLTGEQIKNIGNYWLSADKSVVAILNGLQTRYEGAADEVAETVSGMTNAIKDNALMISQVSTSGVYDAFADKLRIVRDALSEYRDVAVNEGSTALFRKILVDLDSTGELGTRILALIGNVRNLIAAAHELYLSAKPLLSVFGSGLYYQVNTLIIAFDAFADIINGVSSTLKSLNIDTATCIKALSGLYITYKVARMFGTAGQAAASFTYNLVNTATSAASAVPAFAALTTVQKGLLGAVLATGSAYLLLSGALDGIINSFAGLDSTGNVLPTDFETEFEKYQAAMDEYNKAITQYSDDFDDAFASIAETGSSTFALLTKKSAASAKASADSWLASFDEVYKVPEEAGKDDDNTGLEYPDLSALLKSLTFKFPTAEELVPEMPTFDWDAVYNTEDIADGVSSGVSSIIPILVASLTAGFGKAFVKKMATENAKKGLTASAGAGAQTVGNSADVAENVAKQTEAVNNLNDYVSDIAETNKHVDTVQLNTLINNLKQQNAQITKLTRNTDYVPELYTQDLARAQALISRNTLLDLQNEVTKIDKSIDNIRVSPDVNAQTAALIKLQADRNHIVRRMSSLVDKLPADIAAGLPTEMRAVVSGLPNETIEAVLKRVDMRLNSLYASSVLTNSQLDLTTQNVERIISALKDDSDALNKLYTATKLPNPLVEDILTQIKKVTQLQAVQLANIRTVGYRLSVPDKSADAAINELISKNKTTEQQLSSYLQATSSQYRQIIANGRRQSAALTLSNSLSTIIADNSDSIIGINAGMTQGLERAIARVDSAAATNGSLKKITAAINALVNSNINTAQLNFMHAMLSHVADTTANMNNSNKAADFALNEIRRIFTGLGYLDADVKEIAKTARRNMIAGNVDINSTPFSDIQKYLVQLASKATPSHLTDLVGTKLSSIQRILTDNAAAIDRLNTANKRALLSANDLYDDISSALSAIRDSFGVSDTGILSDAYARFDNIDKTKLTTYVRNLLDNSGVLAEDTAKAITQSATAKALLKASNAPRAKDIPTAMVDAWMSTISTRLDAVIENMPKDAGMRKAIASMQSVIESFPAGDGKYTTIPYEAILDSILKANTVALAEVKLDASAEEFKQFTSTMNAALKRMQSDVTNAVLNNLSVGTGTQMTKTAVNELVRQLAPVLDVTAVRYTAQRSATLGKVTDALAETATNLVERVVNKLDTLNVTYAGGVDLFRASLKTALLDNTIESDIIRSNIVNNHALTEAAKLVKDATAEVIHEVVSTVTSSSLPHQLQRDIDARMAEISSATHNSAEYAEEVKKYITSFDADTPEVQLKAIKEYVQTISSSVGITKYTPNTRQPVYRDLEMEAFHREALAHLDALEASSRKMHVLQPLLEKYLPETALDAIVSDKASVNAVTDAIRTSLIGSTPGIRPTGIMLGGMDVGTMITGTSMYGNHVQDVIAKALTATGGISRTSVSATTSMALGYLIEKALGPALQRRLQQIASDALVSVGKTYYDYAAGLKVQNDFQYAMNGQYGGSIEAKATAKSGMFTELADTFGSKYDQATGMYKLAAEDFEKLAKIMPDWVYQAAAQATVTGVNQAMFAIVDTPSLPGYADAYNEGYKVAVAYAKNDPKEQANAVRLAIAPYISQVSTEVNGLSTAIDKHITLIKIDIDDNIKSIIRQTGANYQQLISVVAERLNDGTPLEAILSEIDAQGRVLGGKPTLPASRGIYTVPSFMASNVTVGGVTLDKAALKATALDDTGTLQSLVRRLIDITKKGTLTERTQAFDTLKLLQEGIKHIVATGTDTLGTVLDSEIRSFRIAGSGGMQGVFDALSVTANKPGLVDADAKLTELIANFEAYLPNKQTAALEAIGNLNKYTDAYMASNNPAKTLDSFMITIGRRELSLADYRKEVLSVLRAVDKQVYDNTTIIRRLQADIYSGDAHIYSLESLQFGNQNTVIDYLKRLANGDIQYASDISRATMATPLSDEVVETLVKEFSTRRVDAEDIPDAVNAAAQEVKQAVEGAASEASSANRAADFADWADDVARETDKLNKETIENLVKNLNSKGVKISLSDEAENVFASMYAGNGTTGGFFRGFVSFSDETQNSTLLGKLTDAFTRINGLDAYRSSDALTTLLKDSIDITGASDARGITSIIQTIIGDALTDTDTSVLKYTTTTLKKSLNAALDASGLSKSLGIGANAFIDNLLRAADTYGTEQLSKILNGFRTFTADYNKLVDAGRLTDANIELSKLYADVISGAEALGKNYAAASDVLKAANSLMSSGTAATLDDALELLAESTSGIPKDILKQVKVLNAYSGDLSSNVTVLRILQDTAGSDLDTLRQILSVAAADESAANVATKIEAAVSQYVGSISTAVHTKLSKLTSSSDLARALDALDVIGSSGITDAASGLSRLAATFADLQGLKSATSSLSIIKVAGKTLGKTLTALKDVAIADVAGYGVIDVVAAILDFYSEYSNIGNMQMQSAAKAQVDLLAVSRALNIDSIGEQTLYSLSGLEKLYTDAFIDYTNSATRAVQDAVLQVGGYILGSTLTGASFGGPIGAAIGAIVSMITAGIESWAGMDSEWAKAGTDLYNYATSSEAFDKLSNAAYLNLDSQQTVANANLARIQAAYSAADMRNTSRVATGDAGIITSLYELFTEDSGSYEALRHYLEQLSTEDIGAALVSNNPLSVEYVRSQYDPNNPTALPSAGWVYGANGQEAANTAYTSDEAIEMYARAFASVAQDVLEGDLSRTENGDLTQAAREKQFYYYQTLGTYLQGVTKGVENSVTDFSEQLINATSDIDGAYPDAARTLSALTYALQDVDAYSKLLTQYFNVTSVSELTAAQQGYYASTAAQLLSDYNTAQANAFILNSALPTGANSGYLAMDTSNISTDTIAEYANMFAEATGITIGSLTDLGIAVDGIASDEFYAMRFEGENFINKLTGWVAELPSNFDIGTLSPSEVTVLATAGIQINSDGTIAFANAYDSSTTGKERTSDYDLNDYSAAAQASLANAGIVLDAAGKITLDDALIKQYMTAAIYDMTGVISNVSAAAGTAISGLVTDEDGNISVENANGLGTFSQDTGMFTLTNDAILHGEQTISEWFDAYEAGLNGAASAIPENLKNALLGIDDALKNSSDFEWASGVTVELPADAIDLFSDADLEKLSAANIALTEYGDATTATVQYYSDAIHAGITQISSTAWAEIDDATKEMLKNDLGVTWKELGSWVQVDTSGVLDSFDNVLTFYQKVPDALSDASADFKDFLKLAGYLDDAESNLTIPVTGGSPLAVVASATEDDATTIAMAVKYLNEDLTSSFDALSSNADATTGQLTDYSAKLQEALSGDLAYATMISAETLATYDTNADGIIDTTEALKSGVLVKLSDMDEAAQEALAAALGYSKDEMDQFRSDWAAIDLAGATKEQFLGVTDAYNGLFTKLDTQLQSAGIQLEEEAKQIAIAIGAALAGSFELLTVSQKASSSLYKTSNDSWFSTVNADNKQVPVTLNGTSYTSAADYTAAGGSNLDWNKNSGLGNSVTGSAGNWEIWYNGMYYKASVPTKKEALSLVYFDVFGMPWSAENAKKQSLGIATSAGGISGYANGGIIDDDSLYRIAEQNKKEAVIPLENPQVSAHIGASIASMIVDSEKWQQLNSRVGMRDGGIAQGIATLNKPRQVTQASPEDITNSVLQRVIPAIIQAQAQPQQQVEERMPTAYVNTLIANDAGIRELSRQMRIVDAKDERRR